MTRDEDGPDSERAQRDEKEVQAAHRPDALILHEIIRREGEDELRRTAFALACSAFAAGLSMGFSLIVPGVLKAELPAAPWASIIVSIGYSVGFLIVVLGRQQLFTENTVTPILPLLQNRTGTMFAKVARLWAIVLAFNTLGTCAIAFVLAGTDAFKPEIREAFAALSHHAIDGSFTTLMTRGVFSGWLIALMVWLIPASGSAAPFIIVVMTSLVSLCGLTHVVAGSVDSFYLVAIGELGWDGYLTTFFVPTLLGNLFGGIALVSVLNYGQVAPEIENQDPVGPMTRMAEASDGPRQDVA